MSKLKIWLSVAIALALLGPSQAQLTLTGAGGTKAAVASPSFSLTFASSATSGASTTTIDYGTMTYGSGCTRVVVGILFFTANNVSFPVSAVSIGGTALAAISGAAGADGQAGVGADIWESSASLAGSSGDVQVTWGAAPNPFGGNASVALYCLKTTTPTASSANHNASSSTSSISLASFVVPSGGGALTITMPGNTADTITWTNATTDSTPMANQTFGHATFTGTNTITATASGTTEMVVSAAAWSP